LYQGELSGEIIQVGKNVKTLKRGDRVMAMMGWGGLQEKVVLSPSKCVLIPPNMSFATAAAFPMNYGTSMHALRDRGEVKPGDWVLVLGAAGGVGLTAIEISKVLGAKVIAACSTPEKAAICKSFGADEVILYSKENLKERVAEITGGNGVDVCYDAVGGSMAEPALRSMAWRGRYLVVGFVGGIPKIPLNLTLLKGCQIVGVFWGNFTAKEPEKYEDDMKTLSKWIMEGKLHPERTVTKTWSFENAGQAIKALENRTILGKAVVVVGGEEKLSKL
jgi:NADPH2:quinone reductase